MTEHHLVKAIQSSIDASRAISKIKAEGFEAISKEDGSPVTRADLQAEKIIREALITTYIPILSEEETQEVFEIRRNWECYWCVDPLDGTRGFIKGMSEHTVNIALMDRNIPTIGIIAHPDEELVYFGGKEMGVFKISFDTLQKDWFQDSNQIKSSEISRCIVAISRSRRNELLEEELKNFENDHDNVEVKTIGGALKFLYILDGKASHYLRCTPCMEWDTAAGDALLRSQDIFLTELETGKKLTYNKKSLYQPFFKSAP